MRGWALWVATDKVATTVATSGRAKEVCNFPILSITKHSRTPSPICATSVAMISDSSSLTASAHNSRPWDLTLARWEKKTQRALSARNVWCARTSNPTFSSTPLLALGLRLSGSNILTLYGVKKGIMVKQATKVATANAGLPIVTLWYTKTLSRTHHSVPSTR